jgi:hypothetical protein
MNAGTVFSRSDTTADRERAIPYFSVPARISSAELWGSYLKSALADSRVSEIEATKPAGRPGVPPYFLWPTKWQASTAGLWGASLKSALVFLAKNFRPFQFRTARNLQGHRG